MTLGFVLFGLVFLIALGLGSVTRRPALTASIVIGAVVALLILQTQDPFVALSAFALIAIGGLLLETVRDTVSALLGR